MSRPDGVTEEERHAPLADALVVVVVVMVVVTVVVEGSGAEQPRALVYAAALAASDLQLLFDVEVDGVWRGSRQFEEAQKLMLTSHCEVNELRAIY